MDKMDSTPKLDWNWMTKQMPRVVEMLRTQRRRGGGALIDECWRRGVVGAEPGWFYAHENGVSVGVPQPELLKDPTLAAISAMFPNRALLMLNGQMVDAPEPEPLPAVPSQLERRQAYVRREILSEE